MKISLITTVKNEEKSINYFMDSVLKQTKIPDEIVIVDGGSVDKTVEIIKSYKFIEINLIQEISNIARGRNVAIQNAKHSIITVADAGCILDPKWLENITKYDKDTDVIVGNYMPRIRSIFDACQYSLHSLFKYNDDIKSFVISSRSISFRKKVWEELKGYPEWLDYSEDAYFHEKIKQNKYHIVFAKDAIVYWSLRDSVGSIYKQFFLYMEGNGIAKMNTWKHLIRFVSYITGIALLIVSLNYNYLIYVFLVGFIIYLSAPYINYIKLRRWRIFNYGLIMIPFLVLVMDVAKISGYISGIFKRNRYKLEKI